MAITFIPGEGGVVRNFRIVGNGSICDENKQIITQGTFVKGLLEGQGIVTNYSSEDINIREGTYTAGKENGQIYEYVFPKSEWEAFASPALGAVPATKYTHQFSNGTWVSTSATDSVQINGNATFNARGFMVAFSFV